MSTEVKPKNSDKVNNIVLIIYNNIARCWYYESNTIFI